MTTGNGNGHIGAGSGTPPMTDVQFAVYVERRLAIVDEVAVISRDGMRFELLVGERTVAIDLQTFYSAYARNPAHLDVVFQNFVQAAVQGIPDRSAADIADLLGRVYPMLKPIAILAAVRERELSMLAYSDFLSDLIITYVIDEQRSVTYINDDHLEGWGIGLQELHARALENLRRRTNQDVDFVVVGEGDQRLFIFNSGDGYDATRLLLTDVLARWAGVVAGSLVIGIPNRDFLIAFSDSNPDVLRGVAHQVQLNSAQRDHGLTDQLFTLIGNAVEEYTWE